MVAFVVSLLVTLGLSAVAVLYGLRRPAGAPLSWGEAAVASTFLFGVFFLAYGIVPHQWLTWADNELGWRADKIVFGPGGILEPGRFVPFTITYLVIRDIIATGIYIVFVVLNVAGWNWWQGRGKAKPAVAELETSKYGRPLVRKG